MAGSGNFLNLSQVRRPARSMAQDMPVILALKDGTILKTTKNTLIKEENTCYPEMFRGDQVHYFINPDGSVVHCVDGKMERFFIPDLPNPDGLDVLEVYAEYFGLKIPHGIIEGKKTSKWNDSIVEHLLAKASHF